MTDRQTLIAQIASTLIGWGYVEEMHGPLEFPKIAEHGVAMATILVEEVERQTLPESKSFGTGEG